jgi:hypothetical protein
VQKQWRRDPKTRRHRRPLAGSDGAIAPSKRNRGKTHAFRALCSETRRSTNSSTRGRRQ